MGLSVLVLAHDDLSDVRAAKLEAQCDARYAPPEVDGVFSVPLEREEFALIAKSRATRVSSASYKANFPIEDKYAVDTTESGDVFAAVLDGHGMGHSYIFVIRLPLLTCTFARRSCRWMAGIGVCKKDAD